MKNSILLLSILLSLTVFSQDNHQLDDKLKEAIQLMDSGKIDESISILEECTKADPDNYIYPYEMALAHVFQKNYKEALKILAKAKKLKPSSSQIYQLSGNCYSYLGKSKRAIKEYEAGLKLFPNAGNLHLEKGNVYLYQKEYVKSVKSYQKGIEVDPMFASNYFRLAHLYLQSNDKLSGLIYGELFMNIERSTSRTEEMSKLLFDGYKSSISIQENKVDYDFCEVIIDIKELTTDLKMPFCLIFANNFLDLDFKHKEVNLLTLSKMRIHFLNNYFKKDYKTHPNILFDYLKKIQDSNYINEYNHYLFQKGAQKEFDWWFGLNTYEFNNFIEWYNQPENYLEVKKDNIFEP